MDQKITTIPSVEDAKEFHVARAWNETIKEVLFIEPDPECPDSNHGFKTEAFSTFSQPEVPGYCYILGEAIGLDIFVSKLAISENGLFDNRREWARFRDMLLSLSPNTRPNYMAKIEEYLGRPFNQDIFVYCAEGTVDYLEEFRAAYAAPLTAASDDGEDAPDGPPACCPPGFRRRYPDDVWYVALGELMTLDEEAEDVGDHESEVKGETADEAEKSPAEGKDAGEEEGHGAGGNEAEEKEEELNGRRVEGGDDGGSRFEVRVGV